MCTKCPGPTKMKLTLPNQRFSKTINYHPQMYKTSTPQQERYWAQGEKVIFWLQRWMGYTRLPDRAHHFQVYSAAVASAKSNTINKIPLVISPTKEDSTSGGCQPQPWYTNTILTTQVTKNPNIWAKKCGYDCVRLLLYTHGQHINVLKLFVYV